MAIEPNRIVANHVSRDIPAYCSVRLTLVQPPDPVTNLITGETLVSQEPRFEGEMLIYQSKGFKLDNQGEMYVVVNIDGTLAWKRVVQGFDQATGELWGNGYSAYGSTALPRPERPALSVN